MLNIVCVKWGELYSASYVNILYDMVSRNLSDKTTGKFICFTDNPEGLDPNIEVRELPGNLTGWWNKLYLFKKGLFPTGERIIYLDLDTVITGGLDHIFAYNGSFAILRDFYRLDGYQSSVMSWCSGICNHLWEKYKIANYPSIEGGDQAWIERHVFDADIWQELYPDCFVSYKVSCKQTIPKNAKIVVFHGNPRPHEVLDGWVSKIWKMGGGSSLELEVVANTDLETIKSNIRHSITLGKEVLDSPLGENEKVAVIVGGAPSIKNFIKKLKEYNKDTHTVVALNNSWKWLTDNGVEVDTQVMLDAREENKSFIPPELLNIAKLYASQCHPLVVEKATCLWHALIPDAVDSFPDNNMFWVGSGSSVGIRSIILMWVLGYRKFEIYGYDSSYSDGEGHAYSQVLNDGEKIIEVTCGDRQFKTAPWMVTQTEEFLQVMEYLTAEGGEFTIYGEGLLPYAAKTMLIPKVEGIVCGEISDYDGTWWPTECTRARMYHAATMTDIEYILSFVTGTKLCIQAGGNVGLWPKEFSKHFEAVYTFEPDHVNFRCLNLNCDEKNIVKTQAALGSHAAFIDLHRISNNCGAHSVGGYGLIPTLRIDDFGFTNCDLIQLDIEGYEHNALLGAIETIKKFHPVIVVEDKGLSEKYGTEKGHIETWLKDFGYSLVSEIHRDLIFIPNKR